MQTTNGLQIVDLKTRKAGTRKAYESDIIQTSAYRIAHQEMYGSDIRSTAILLALEDGSYKFLERTIPDDLFLSILDVYNALRREKL